ncbi:Rv2993c-like domain-containing protein [Nocardia seriolae]|uniref:Anaerobic glycerol-3-phosphate dehydrogenase subunit n=1 Tax=Nocardia seriolae TaxID=37332 RepID=A0ABC9Z011_9NOCA|nr:Rv2993c-like domain-containing protein [Nocardia seriolae]APA98669.1 Anaerobic glycerol-3-phosphate dehydrogenase subunit [Nocardia seriolae]QUN17124.1 DUF2437 domain-containing protein [Nocardia seriolae]WKY55751.1 DUF2437 domain-containing protein [Nocardia seriolae]WNJ62704.1 DUF2437 domain-containing protein [Nocardia seriolae]GAM48947.1 FAD-binding protein [Nocardia seriolae]
MAARVRQVEELLVEAIDAGRLQLRADSRFAGRRIVFHGHCHQKAEVGTAATMALLRRIPGAVVEEIDSGCCGMAGSFGFESEHYETSLAVGEDRLFPALAAEPADTIVAATGVSCRQQIFHGAGRTAWHPVELVREALAENGNGMRIVRYALDGQVGRGIAHGDKVHEFPWGAETPGALVARLSELELLAPCEPGTIVCAGSNYAGHLAAWAHCCRVTRSRSRSTASACCAIP